MQHVGVGYTYVPRRINHYKLTRKQHIDCAFLGNVSKLSETDFLSQSKDRLYGGTFITKLNYCLCMVDDAVIGLLESSRICRCQLLIART